MSSIELRDYQEASIEALRDGLRKGYERQILCAPCGAGKTVVAASLIKGSIEKGSKSLFIVDRTTLVRQTSERFYEFDIDHGLIWAGNTHSPYQPVQVCSAQTLEARDYIPECDFVVVDEAHIQRKKINEFIVKHKKRTIGLTATPFTQGLGNVYQNVVNVTSTNKLIEEGWITPLKVYAAKEIDMKGAKTDAKGEWTNKEVRQRGAKIIGDIVTEWELKTRKEFGGPVKTLVFSADVSHGKQIQKEFKERGYHFEQLSHLDTNEQRRKSAIDGFRNGSITGLISCEVLGRGFDVPDVLCMIAARPYRRSLASHIQQIGRVMRPSPGKDFGLLLDHSGNWLGHMDATLDFFANGVDTLSYEHARDVRKEGNERPKFACPQCSLVPNWDDTHCRECGFAFPAKGEKQRSTTQGPEFAPGVMEEIDFTQKSLRDFKYDKSYTWREICNVALKMCKTQEKAVRTAKVQYKNMFNEWPQWNFVYNHDKPPDIWVERKVKRQLNDYRKRMAIQRKKTKLAA